MNIRLTDRYTDGRVTMLVDVKSIRRVIPESTGAAVVLAGGGHPIDVIESADEIRKMLEVVGHVVL